MRRLLALVLLMFMATGALWASEPLVLQYEGIVTDDVVTLPLSGELNVEINWGDGNSATYVNQSLPSHTYSSSGNFTITVTGNCEQLGQAGYPKFTNIEKLIQVDSWGDLGFVSFENAFYRASSLTTVPATLPSTVKSLSYMFNEASTFNGDITRWDVSNVTDMSNMFRRATLFNQDIGGWDLSSCTTILGMFVAAKTFNKDISNWNISKVREMAYLFSGASSFNQNINGWDVSKIEDFSGVFGGAKVFNQSLYNWDVSSATNMEGMFSGTEKFNQNLENWDVSNVTNMNQMFASTVDFNGSIETWDVSNVITMYKMFQFSHGFNRPIGSWNVSKVEDMYAMFHHATAFNQPVNSWNISSVRNLEYVFGEARSFEQSLSNWDVSNVTSMGHILKNVSLPATYYDAMLINWSKLPVQENVPFGAERCSYTSKGEAARQSLIDRGWRINDGGVAVIPTISKDPYVSVDDKSAYVLFQISDLGAPAVVSLMGVRISTTADFTEGTYWDVMANQPPISGDVRTVTVKPDNLEEATTYYFTPFAENGAGRAFGDTIVKTTYDMSPVSRDKTVGVKEDQSLTFQSDYFHFYNQHHSSSVLQNVKIHSYETEDELLFDGKQIQPNQIISVNDIPKITYTPQPDSIGHRCKLIFSVEGNDKYGYSDNSYTLTVSVQNVNDAPVINSKAPTTVTAGDQWEYQIDAHDIDNGRLDYELTNAPADMLVYGSLLVWRPKEGVMSSGEVTLTVSDYIESVTETFTVTVIVPDKAPVVKTPINDIIIPEDSRDSIISLADLFTDTDNDDAAIVKTVTANNNESLVIATVENNLLTLNLSENRFGKAVIEITGTSNGKSVSSSFNVDVTPVNDAPTLTTMTVPSIAEDGSIELTLDMGDFEDIDSENLTLIVGEGNNYTFTGTTVTPTANWSGTVTVPVSVSDGKLTSATVNASIVVTPVNDAPTLTEVKVPAFNEDGSIEITLAMTDADDVDGNDLTLIVSEGDNYTFTGTTITPTADWNGTLLVPISVTDGEFTTEAVTASILVNPVDDITTTKKDSTATSTVQGSVITRELIGELNKEDTVITTIVNDSIRDSLFNVTETYTEGVLTSSKAVFVSETVIVNEVSSSSETIKYDNSNDITTLVKDSTATATVQGAVITKELIGEIGKEDTVVTTTVNDTIRDSLFSVTETYTGDNLTNSEAAFVSETVTINEVSSTSETKKYDNSNDITTLVKDSTTTATVQGSVITTELVGEIGKEDTVITTTVNDTIRDSLFSVTETYTGDNLTNSEAAFVSETVTINEVSSNSETKKYDNSNDITTLVKDSTASTTVQGSVITTELIGELNREDTVITTTVNDTIRDSLFSVTETYTGDNLTNSEAVFVSEIVTINEISSTSETKKYDNSNDITTVVKDSTASTTVQGSVVTTELIGELNKEDTVITTTVNDTIRDTLFSVTETYTGDNLTNSVAAFVSEKITVNEISSTSVTKEYQVPVAISSGINIDTDFVGIAYRENPVQLSDESAEIIVGAPSAQEIRIVIFDVLGNLIDEQESATSVDGSHSFFWDLKNRNGQRVANGSYRVIAQITNVDGTKVLKKSMLGVQR